MGITPMFGDDAIGAQVRLFQKRLEEAAIYLLKYLGEELTKYARINTTTRTERATSQTQSAMLWCAMVIFSTLVVQSNKERAQIMR